MGIDGCCSAKWCIGTKIEPKNKSSVTFSILLFQGEKLTSRLAKSELDLLKTISWRKPAADKPSCVPMFSHPSPQQHNKQRALKKTQEQFCSDPGCSFYKPDNSQAWLAKKKTKKNQTPKKPNSQNPPKNLRGKRVLFLVPTFVHSTQFSIPSSAAYIKKLVFPIYAWGQALPAAYKGRKNSSLWSLLSKPDWVQCTMHVKHCIWCFGW